ncbi:hypothetical protein QC763_121475 [Podospora pseudopauciseta]|uniref:Uncharacterized protein n=1 Tax=Podospora pseudopauciseta TaxID=2093780 RepID=A0ABR0I2E2_9PEZI|nr:hypothetical protein QC763_121475 [Podospora pseudopauciseta]
MAATDPIHSWMYFLQRDPKFETERVYELRRQKPTKKVPQTNMLLEKVDNIAIHDVRPRLEQCSFGYLTAILKNKKSSNFSSFSLTNKAEKVKGSFED